METEIEHKSKWKAVFGGRLQVRVCPKCKKEMEGQ